MLTVQCPKCGHTWLPRVQFPAACPNQCGQRWPAGKPEQKEARS